MARTSVERRVTTPRGGIRVIFCGGGSPPIIRSSRAAASKPVRRVSGSDAREGRIGQVAEHVVVVDAEHGHVLGDGDLDVAAGVQDLLPADVVARHQADRLGQGLDPLRHLGLGGASPLLQRHRPDRPALAGGLVDVTDEARLLDQGGEGARAVVGVVRAGEAAEGEVAETPLEEMLDRQPGHGDVVGGEERHLEVGEQPAEVDGRQSQLADRMRDLAVLDAGDDPVPLPALEPGGRGIPEAALRQVDRPGTVQPDVLGDPVQQAAAVGTRRLHQQGDAWSNGHDCISQDPRGDSISRLATIPTRIWHERRVDP